MEKENLIKEAWGSYWKYITNEDKGFLLRNDGWLPSKSMQYLDIINQDHFEWKEIRTLFNDEVSFSHLRPKSLQGIENNNGWVKIESEEDLPKECGTYHIVVSGIVYVDEYNSCTKEFSEWFNHAITHYQHIVKPLLPLY